MKRTSPPGWPTSRDPAPSEPQENDRARIPWGAIGLAFFVVALGATALGSEGVGLAALVLAILAFAGAAGRCLEPLESPASLAPHGRTASRGQPARLSSPREGA